MNCSLPYGCGQCDVKDFKVKMIDESGEFLVEVKAMTDMAAMYKASIDWPEATLVCAELIQKIE